MREKKKFLLLHFQFYCYIYIARMLHLRHSPINFVYMCCLPFFFVFVWCLGLLINCFNRNFFYQKGGCRLEDLAGHFAFFLTPALSMVLIAYIMLCILMCLFLASNKFTSVQFNQARSREQRCQVMI